MQHTKAESKNEAMAELLNATSEADRNKYLAAAMADVDIFYLAYRDELLRSDNAFNASVDLVSLAADLAGRLTDSVGVKDNYLTLGALLGGGRSTVNNRFLYAQTSIVLVKGMDAARASTALAIKTRQSQRSIQEYSGRDAYADVLEYYFNGTLAGGLVWLQSSAEEQEVEDKKSIAELPVPTEEQYRTRFDLMSSVQPRLVSTAALRKGLAAFGMTPPADAGLDELRKLFTAEYGKRLREGTSPEDMRKQLADAKFFED